MSLATNTLSTAIVGSFEVADVFSASTMIVSFSDHLSLSLPAKSRIPGNQKCLSSFVSFSWWSCWWCCASTMSTAYLKTSSWVEIYFECWLNLVKFYATISNDPWVPSDWDEMSRIKNIHLLLSALGINSSKVSNFATWNWRCFESQDVRENQ